MPVHETPRMSAETEQNAASANPQKDGAEGFDAARWEWWAGPDDEYYRCGPHKSREDAIEEAMSDYADASHIYVIEAVPQRWPAPDATSVIDHMIDNSYDLFSDEFPDLLGTKERQEEAERELQATLDAWMDKWRNVIFPPPTLFARSRNAECIPIAATVPSPVKEAE